MSVDRLEAEGPEGYAEATATNDEEARVKQYHDALREVLEQGVTSTDRTGTGTISHFGMQQRYRMAEGFPLVTTKKLHLKSIVHELLWFLAGDTNIAYLKENGVRIWDEWADENGDLGPVYGHQWRRFPMVGDPMPQPDGTLLHQAGQVDQIAKLVEAIRKTPDSRRLIVSAWNPGEVDQMALPPCHTLWQVRIAGGKLHLQLYQRSADMFLGVPFFSGIAKIVWPPRQKVARADWRPRLLTNRRGTDSAGVASCRPARLRANRHSA